MTRPDDGTDEIGAAIRAASGTVEAPPALRERLDHVPRGKSGAGWAAALGLIAAVAAVVLVLGGGGPTVEQVAAAALNPPTAPAGDASPYGDWQPVGARDDTVDGSEAHTVIYRKGRLGAHYTIVDDELDLPGGRREEVSGTTYVLATDGDANIVAWYANGKTCVLASTMADLDSLLTFATYSAG